MLNKKWSETGYGRRTMFPAFTCKKEDNLLPVLSDITAWKANAENADMLSSLSENEICFTADFNKTFIKWLEVKPETVYFLSFTGRTVPPEWTDLHFGIVDKNGFPFKNYHTKHEKSFFVTDQGFDQMLTVRGQDGEWYPRVYSFYTGANEKIGFFADGSCGRVILKEIKLFEAIKAENPEVRVSSGVMNYKEDINDCAPENNYVADTAFFEKFEYFNSFIFREKEIIKYSPSNKGCCYFAWLPLEENRIYTFSFKEHVIKSGGACYGFVAENSKGKRRWLLQKSASAEGTEQVESNAFALVRGEKIAFAVFDGGGEVQFSDFKIFLFGNGLQKISDV